MRSSLIVALALVTLPACSTSSSVPDARKAAAALRQCFESIAPVDVPEKAKLLAPCAEKDGPALIASLEKATPTAPQVDCHADGLAGARRAVGAMQDMLKVYRRNADDTGRRAVAAARNVDQGLTQLEAAIADCTK
jgi:hypothetical protein